MFWEVLLRRGDDIVAIVVMIVANVIKVRRSRRSSGRSRHMCLLRKFAWPTACNALGRRRRISARSAFATSLQKESPKQKPTQTK